MTVFGWSCAWAWTWADSPDPPSCNYGDTRSMVVQCKVINSVCMQLPERKGYLWWVVNPKTANHLVIAINQKRKLQMIYFVFEYQIGWMILTKKRCQFSRNYRRQNYCYNAGGREFSAVWMQKKLLPMKHGQMCKMQKWILSVFWEYPATAMNDFWLSGIVSPSALIEWLFLETLNHCIAHHGMQMNTK